MPINWESQFKIPLTQQIKSGQINKPDKLFGQIITLYDACIKTGLPAPPATIAGPIIGNITALKSALDSFSGIQKSKQEIHFTSIISDQEVSKTKEISKILNKLSTTDGIEKSILLDNLDYFKSYTIPKTIPKPKFNSNFVDLSKNIKSSNKQAEIIELNKKLSKDQKELKNLVSKINTTSNLDNKLVKDSTLDILKFKLDTIKEEILETQKTLNIKQYNPKETALRQAITTGISAYWAGMSSLAGATVINPGIISSNLLSLSPSNGTNTFVDDLINFFRLQLSSVSGTYISPSGVVLPWVGYF